MTEMVKVKQAAIAEIAAARAEHRSANLEGAYLEGANLEGAYLGNADLRRADLADADLRRAYLGNADLRRADLADADLRRADLADADLHEGTRVLQLGPIGPHRVYATVLAISGQAEDVRLGCERGTLATLTALAQTRYGAAWERHYGVAFRCIAAWLEEAGPK